MSIREQATDPSSSPGGEGALKLERLGSWVCLEGGTWGLCMWDECLAGADLAGGQGFSCRACAQRPTATYCHFVFFFSG